MTNLPPITPRIDTAELSRIKNTFALRERVNSDRYEADQSERRNPQLLFDSSSTPGDLTTSTLQGLKYPLELDGRGGLKLSSGYDRIGEQILEILETRYGERVYRPFFGIPELLFETIDEYSLAQSIRSQLRAFLPGVQKIDVKVSLSEDGGATVVVFYAVEGSEGALVRYSFAN